MKFNIPKPGMFVKDRNIIDSDFSPLKINKEKVKKLTWNHRGSVRLSSGKFYTSEEFETRKKTLLKKPLP